MSAKMQSPQDQACSDGNVLIQIRDSQAEILCGCQGENEKPGIIFNPDNPLNCHSKSLEPTCFFQFISTGSPHQLLIKPANGESFLSPSFFEPTSTSDSLGLETYGIAFSSLTKSPGSLFGSYFEFEDLPFGLKGAFFIGE